MRAPWADFLYACDENWWETYWPDFEGERWTQSKNAPLYGARRCPGQPGYILSEDPSYIFFGGNSGFQAVNLAYTMGAARIVLVGFDMQATGGKLHWHPDHGGRCHNPPVNQIAKWAHNFDRLADQLADNCVEAINCTAETALTMWPRRTLEEVFGD